MLLWVEVAEGHNEHFTSLSYNPILISKFPFIDRFFQLLTLCSLFVYFAIGAPARGRFLYTWLKSRLVGWLTVTLCLSVNQCANFEPSEALSILAFFLGG